MTYRFVIALASFLYFHFVAAQDIYNPDLIAKLKVKEEREIRTTYYKTDTTIYKYDKKGRCVYRKAPVGCMQGIDSTFYSSNEEIRKNYSDNLKLNLIDKKTTKDNVNTIIYDFIHFYYNPPYHKVTELKFKHDTLVFRKTIENDKVTDLFENGKSKLDAMPKKSEPIIDTTYDYTYEMRLLLNYVRKKSI